MDVKKKQNGNNKIKKVRYKRKSVIVSTLFILSVICNLILVYNMETNEENKTKNKILVNAADISEDVTSDDFDVIQVEQDTEGSLTENTVEPYASSRSVSGLQSNIDYVKSKIILTSSNGSTKFYISKDKQKSWELLNSTVKGSSTELELAAYMKTSEVVLYFKGDKDLTPIELKIPKEETDLKVTYKVSGTNGSLVFTNRKGALLEYRTSATGYWIEHNSDTFDTSAYDDTGMTLQFRTKATTNKRAGKIVNAKIPKRPSAPTVKVDFQNMEITGLKKGNTQYRVGNNSTWTTFNPSDTKVKGLSLYDILSNGTVSNTTQLNANTIEFRTIIDGKKVPSAIKLLDFNKQPSAPNIDGVLSGSTITIKDASKDKPYEYVVLKTTEIAEMNPKTAKWKRVTSPKSIIIKKTGNATTIKGDVVFIRLAAVTDAKTSKITPPSLYAQKVIESTTP